MSRRRRVCACRRPAASLRLLVSGGLIGYFCSPIGNQAHAIMRALAFEQIKRFIRSRAGFDAFDGKGILAHKSLAPDLGGDDLQLSALLLSQGWQDGEAEQHSRKHRGQERSSQRAWKAIHHVQCPGEGQSRVQRPSVSRSWSTSNTSLPVGGGGPLE